MFPAKVGRTRPSARRLTTECSGRRLSSGSVHDGVEHLAPGRLRRAHHGFDDGGTDAAAPVRRVHGHRDLHGVEVVAQRAAPSGRRRASAHPAPPAPASRNAGYVPRNRAKARMSRSVNPASVGPDVLVRGTEDVGRLGQPRLVVRFDPAHLHGPTLPRVRGGEAQRKTPRIPSRPPRCSWPERADLLVGQRALGRAEAQPVGQAARALVDPRSPVDVEEAHRLEYALPVAGRSVSATASAGCDVRSPRRPGRCPRTGTG